ncbi:MAG TPA: tetratricopeptide repeat protein [Candidatus Limnocylindrales bacterium]|nr:tetratricopeptide repeat protein [Candidatus Limnocylindrales bacterium]
MKTRILLAAGLLIAIACAALWWWMRPSPLRETDYLLLGEFANQSGEQAFDGSLREALRVALLQSPYLNLISDEKIRGVLGNLGKPQSEPLTPQLSKTVCERLGAIANLNGRVSHTAEGYTFELVVSRCPGGDLEAKETGEAKRTDQVIHQIGLAASRLRADLGEHEDTLKIFDMPLERATTPVPAALKAYALARAAVREKGDLEAVPYYKKAIDLDSRFAMARSGLAVSYYNLNQMAQASDEIRQAYEAGDRQTLRERLNIKTLYYDLAQGDIEKAIGGYKEYIRLYPHDDVALGNLSSEFFVLGDYEQAARYSEEALKIDPDSAAWYENHSTALLALSRVDEAEKTIMEAFSRKLDDPALHANLYSVAFLKGNTALMQEQLRWAAGRSSGEDSLLAAQSDTEAYFGRLKQAREYTTRAVNAAVKADLRESAAVWSAQAGLREAMLGYPAEAQKDAREALRFASESKDVRALVALIFARIGNEAEAQSITDDLRALYVSNTVIQKAWLPVVRAQVAMHKRKDAEAIEQLESVLPYEKGQLTGNLSDSCMIPAYLRGEAELRTQRARQAALEFQKIEVNPGVIGNCWSGALAKLGKARSQAAAGSPAEARVSYQQFLSLWKNADPELPLLKQAKAEAAKLR